MDAQHSRKGSCQYRLQRQWHPTDKQTHGDATGHRVSVTRQPRAWDPVQNCSRHSHHVNSNGRGQSRMKGNFREFRKDRNQRFAL